MTGPVSGNRLMDDESICGDLAFFTREPGKIQSERGFDSLHPLPIKSGGRFAVDNGSLKSPK
jgi:hypothetical protein